ASWQSGGLSISRSAVLTDSTYVWNGARSAPYWAADRWLSRGGPPIENPDLWKQLLTARARVRGHCDVKWIKGKSTPILRAVDKLAKQAAKGPVLVDHGYSGGTFARRRSVGKRDAAM